MMCHPSDDGRLVPAPPRSACACLLEHTIGANAFDSSWHIAVSKLGVNHVIWPGSAAMRREKGSAVLSSDNFRKHRYSSSCNNDCWMACGRRAEPISNRSTFLEHVARKDRPICVRTPSQTHPPGIPTDRHKAVGPLDRS